MGVRGDGHKLHFSTHLSMGTVQGLTGDWGAGENPKWAFDNVFFNIGGWGSSEIYRVFTDNNVQRI